MKVVSIRKYANRKLYDQERAAYLSMFELSDLVAQGVRVTVTCDVTGADLTFSTLARALYERSKQADTSADLKSLSAAVERIMTKLPVKDLGE